MTEELPPDPARRSSIRPDSDGPTNRNPALDETIAPDSGDTAADAQFSTESIPQALGRYEIEKLLGRGGMGAVYLAHDSQLDRKVALKVPKFDTSANEKSITRFYREARSAANLSHPNLCQVFDVGEIDGTHYIAMAFIKGRPLSDYVSEGKPANPKVAAGIIRKVANGMEEAHHSGIIHRDLKPANIMIDHRNEPIVMDFGLAVAHETDTESRLTQDGALLGSPAYMSPEQLQGDLERIGPASDVYALGVVLYELLARRLPFDGSGSTIAMIGQILTKDPISLAELREDLDPAIIEICQRAMSKDIAGRYQSMKEFAGVLGTYIKTGSATSTKKSASKPATGAKTVSVSTIQLNEKAKLAKTLCDSGQYSAAIPVLSQIIESGDAKGTKALQYAQAMLPKAKQAAAKQTPTSPSVPAASVTAANDPFADLPDAPGTAATPYRPPPRRSNKSANNMAGKPAVLIGVGLLAAVALAGIGYIVMSDGGSDATTGTTTPAAQSAVEERDKPSTAASTPQNQSSTDDQADTSGRRPEREDRGGKVQDFIRDFEQSGGENIIISNLPIQMRRPFTFADRDNDGEIDKSELEELKRQLRSGNGPGGQKGFGPGGDRDRRGGPGGPGRGGGPGRNGPGF